MTVLAAVAVPHPPLIFPEVGKGKEKQIQKTINSYREAMKFVDSFAPDTIILISPHMRWYADYFHVASQPKTTDNFAQFGAPEVKITACADESFIAALNTACQARNFPCGILGEQEQNIDHGSFIPLRFLNEIKKDYKVVRIAVSGLSVLYHYMLGQILNEISLKLNRRSVIIASGDWSHKLLAEGPYGFAEEGPEFDKKLQKIFKSADFLPLLKMKSEFCEAAGECGHRPFVIMSGALDSRAVKSKLLSYEGPFGVGYGVAAFEAGVADEKRNFGTQYREWKQQMVNKQAETEDEFVRLARYCIETFVLTGKPALIPQQLPTELTANRAGVFVSLKMHGQLRGCIGTIAPVYNDIADEIAHNAIAACSQDPRFMPVRPDELADLVYSVDVLQPAEPIAAATELDVKKYGVIVESNGKRGLLLPDIDGVDTVEQQIAIARQKGGISPSEKAQLYRFEVIRHH